MYSMLLTKITILKDVGMTSLIITKGHLVIYATGSLLYVDNTQQVPLCMYKIVSIV